MNAGSDEVVNEAPPVEPPLLAPWARIGGDYIVRKLIGRGGQSQIYEGYDTRHERVVAIKIFLFKHQLNASMLKRAKAEAEAEMRLTHPNIVKVYAAGVSEILDADGRKKELFYSVMEFLEGETLEDRLYRTGKLGFAEALWILAEAGDGLAMLHLRKIIHRDIKPENIFLATGGEEGRPRVVLIDLGIAKLDPKEFSVQRTDANILMGTFAYMSPEQIHHKFPVDGRTDLYALGLVAFKCFTSVHPAWNHFEQPNPPQAEEYAAWHMAAVPPLVSTLRLDAPASIDALVASMCAKLPDDRPESAIAASKEIRAILAKVEAAPKPVVPLVPQGRRAPPGPISPSERWRPMGQATTQEDETTQGPTTAGLVPVRLREAPAPVSEAVPSSAEVVPSSAEVVPSSAEPMPSSAEVVSSRASSPPRSPLRTSAGTEILEASSVRPLATEEPPRSSSPTHAREAPRTRTGTEIVPRDKLPSIALDATPLDISIAMPSLMSGATPGAETAEIEPARTTVELSAQGGPRPRTLPFSKRKADEKPASKRSAAGEAGTTSGHHLSVAPRSTGRYSSRGALIVAALAGAVSGLAALAIVSPYWHRTAPPVGVTSATSATSPAFVAEVLPDASVAPPSSAAVLPEPDAPVDLPDADAGTGDAAPSTEPKKSAAPPPAPVHSPKQSGAWPKPAAKPTASAKPAAPEPDPPRPSNKLPRNAAPIPIRNHAKD